MLKHYETWDKFALNHEVKRNVVLNCIHKTIQKIKGPLKEALIVVVTKSEQIKKGIKFDDYPEVGLVIDVTFQTRTRPKMLFKEAQYYFSGKHSSYGYKTEVAHLPNGLAVFVSDFYAGSVHDFTIFKDNLEIYKTFLQKIGSDHKIEDKGELKDKYPKSWALLVDKGYQGASDLMRAIVPKKGKDLPKEEQIKSNHL